MSYVSQQVKDKFDGIVNEMISRIKAQQFDYIEVGVFGSYARNEYNALSDVDICVIVPVLPQRAVSGWLRDDAEELGADIVFILKEDYDNESSPLIKNIKKDYKRIC